MNKSVFSQQILATAFASNVLTFGSKKLNESQYQNIQNKNGKRTFSNIVSDSNKENESRPSSLAKNPLVYRNSSKQRRLDVNNSTNPDSKLGSINPNSEEGYKVAKKRPNKGQNKRKNWIKSAGKKEIPDFKVAESLCTVHIGRVNTAMNISNIQNLLSPMNISFSNLNQLETCHNNFKSFTFIFLTKKLLIKKISGQEDLL